MRLFCFLNMMGFWQGSWTSSAALDKQAPQAETGQHQWETKGQASALPQAPCVTAGNLLHLSVPWSPAVNNTSLPLLCLCPCQFRL